MADAHPQATSFECPMDFCVEFWNLAKKWYKDPYVVYKFVFIIAIPALLVIFGIVGNLLSFAVLATRKLTSATLLLRVLAIADTSVLISIFLFHSLPHLEKLNMINRRSHQWNVYKIFGFFCRLTMDITSVFDAGLVVLVGIDRLVSKSSMGGVSSSIAESR